MFEMCEVSEMFALCVGRYVPVCNQLVYNYRTGERLVAATSSTMCKHCGECVWRSASTPRPRGSDSVPNHSLSSNSRGVTTSCSTPKSGSLTIVRLTPNVGVDPIAEPPEQCRGEINQSLIPRLPLVVGRRVLGEGTVPEPGRFSRGQRASD